MMRKPFNLITILGLLLAVAPLAALGQGMPPPADLESVAEKAYIFGYPLVTMEMTRRVMANVALSLPSSSSPRGRIHGDALHGLAR